MKQNIVRLFILFGLVVLIYGIGRLYFHVTAGFTIGNISSDFAFQPQWEVFPLDDKATVEFNEAIDQPYRYFAKGCQSYAFISQDGRYVIKFFKQQKFCLPFWVTYFPPLPAVVKYREEKSEKKWKMLDLFVSGWKIAFNHLKDECGLIYVHLNKTDHLKKTLTIFDKMGMRHELSLDKLQFCVQKKAEMLTHTLLVHKSNQDLASACQLIQQILDIILFEYSCGIVDKDDALMQNTGVVNGKPIHIDLGQFVIEKTMKKPEIISQELFTRMFAFREWLKENYPEAYLYLDLRLQEVIGSKYPTMQPHWRDRETRWKSKMEKLK